MDDTFSHGYCQMKDSPVDHRKAEGSFRPQTAKEKMKPPRDPCSCIYLALVMSGAGFLLPYNSFITAVDYYQDRFPRTTIEFDMSLTYIVVAFFSVVATNVLVETFSLKLRITFGYIVAFTVLLLVTICDIWLEMFSKETSYGITLMAVGMVAVGSTIQQSSFYGYTSMLPHRYTQAVMTGESAAGLVISSNRILTKALLHNQRTNTIIFFTISLTIVCLCFILFHVVRRSQFVRYYVSQCEMAGLAEEQRGIANPNPASGPFTEEVSLVDIMDHTGQRGSYGVLVIQSPTSASIQQEFLTGSAPVTPTTPTNPEIKPATATELTKINEQEVKYKGHIYKVQVPKMSSVKRALLLRWEATKCVWPYMISLGMAYFVTLLLFPGVESQIISCRLRSWTPVILMAIFNLFDFIGKVIAAIPYDWPRGRLILFTCFRILLVPMMMMCVLPVHKPTLNGEGYAVLASLLLGVTNGYFGSVPMILAPMKVSSEKKEITGNIMMFSYSIGMTTGSIGAYILDYFIGANSVESICTAAIHPHHPALTNIAGHHMAPSIPASLNATSMLSNFTNLSVN
ncbi:equilibrative nucleoside transporter 4-like isoform X1 [Octopus sinensis]|uniref:Equilibrative nucleoside transporter 4-like isoform X1 n=1 Tax=Octopus sinensis TaxID=2607531 RepID=A0A6P7TB09_9MOLL|nr:equilibrative nucleoside transporter 4-like isoform X1 [Octopus sinensis]XP_036366886.1 equilibrative nucleoside transporter 4-like isoform X1 [Octopus sinensis]XP_036366887.1 equilibrative nucleoside transporter 4-like isoform X1 [Octopus sinensis]